MAESSLSEEQFARLAPLLPTDTRDSASGQSAGDLWDHARAAERRRWVDAPVCYGPKTLYDRWVRWARKGVWQRAFETLAAAGGPPAELMLDSNWAKAHHCATGGKGRSTPTP